ncbi:class I SAM-dependent methyltransferase, partial [Candidatus Pelagibacter sp.]|nr:class I SAM-dependent methyltransferase [Candidatus Pelagibacter sp.]
IERNFVSKRVRYGWDSNNSEGYNDLSLLNNFLIKNGLSHLKFNIFDFDRDVLPDKKFDLVISLFSLDYHYNFDIYLNYLKKNTHKDTKIIFDTIRADYFKSMFKEVILINSRTNTVHSSKRIICSNFI